MKNYSSHSSTIDRLVKIDFWVNERKNRCYIFPILWCFSFQIHFLLHDVQKLMKACFLYFQLISCHFSLFWSFALFDSRVLVIHFMTLRLTRGWCYGGEFWVVPLVLTPPIWKLWGSCCNMAMALTITWEKWPFSSWLWMCPSTFHIMLKCRIHTVLQKFKTVQTNTVLLHENNSFQDWLIPFQIPSFILSLNVGWTVASVAVLKFMSFYGIEKKPYKDGRISMEPLPFRNDLMIM